MHEETVLSLQGITKSFDGVPVLKGLSIDIQKGEFITLLGPSGCGKTTTLRIVAGLETPDAGRVILEGKDVTDDPPNKRAVNTVFQNYALFPHMNVYNNIAYGMKLRKEPADKMRTRVTEMLDLIQLPGYEKRMPDQLSGGQRQRVAIARAIVNNPSVLLLDEPLGALDLQLRRQMQVELRRLQKMLGMTFIYITHDQEEALNMSDRIAVMNNGQFEQIGNPDDIYERPQTRFAATFIGSTNLLETKVTGEAENGLLQLSFAGGVIYARDARTWHVGDTPELSVRTERIRYGDVAEYGFNLKGTIKEHSFVGGMRHTTLTLADGQELQVSAFVPAREYEAGEEVQIWWDPDHAPIVGGGESA